MSVPLNEIVRINPGVLGVGNNGNDLYGLLITKNTDLPSSKITKNTDLPSSKITTINSADQVSALFGGDSTEYELSNVYFTGFERSDRSPDILYMAPYTSGNTSASLQGGNITSLTEADMRNLSGALTIDIDGKTHNIDGLNFNTVNSLSDVASVLGKALGVTVVYSSATQGLIIKSPTTGSTSSVGFATGLLATDLRLSTEQGAIQSPSTSGQTLTNLLNTLREQNNAFCSVFLTWTPTEEERLELAAWATSMKEDVCVFINDVDNAAITQSTGASFAEKMQARSYTGVVPVYNNLNLCALFASIPASWDFEKTNGRWTFAFRKSPLVTSNVTEVTQFRALVANGYNFSTVLASGTVEFRWSYNGTIISPYGWLDSWFCQIWMRRTMQRSYARCLESKGTIPFNTSGQSILRTAVLPAINSFSNFGAIAPGISLDSTQVVELKNQGLSQEQINTITTVGYYLSIDVTSTRASQRVQRKSPKMGFWYTDGQSIHQIIQDSIGIQ
ncbi:DUF3383 family protein [Commensalibacter communis]|uniref:DUF3383 family protein n=1 Tax=Commensalibacter communis TaxID=2972786 RepID=UPI0022FFB4D3|nr:DUF3383 family protein [Commensalibacter communis]CAI3933387.1 unnamed protein product [Commensalibacter communis]CAI3944815.1 unnamed protein product [Commensalibacter communis]